MTESKAHSANPIVDSFIGVAFLAGGALWIAVMLFFAEDAIGDWREAHPRADGGPTWWEGFQHVGGIGGALVGLAPPMIAVSYGFYFVASSLRRLCLATASPNLQ